MKTPRYRTILSCGNALLSGRALAALFCLANTQLFANGEIFPAEGPAKEKISWANNYFQIEGKSVFLNGGEIHYTRIPRELWRDRLWRMKQMGLNTVQFYTFWNSHEPKDGEWDFSGNSDLDAFLSMVKEMGFYAIARVGPYCCAEWEHGGFPSWLTTKPGMVLRAHDEQYLRYVDRFHAKVFAIVAKQQIQNGGALIMLQLENELPGAWGTNANPYVQHLYDKARGAGLQIPLFFSGLHHGNDPSGEEPFKMGNSPWYSTEFWSGWIGRYGDMIQGVLEQKVRGTWKIIAFGGGGYGYYMVHGGSNFGYSGDSWIASYDYSAPIGECGVFNNFYGPSRRAAMFAQGFSSLLTSSRNAPEFASATAKAGRITTRKSSQGAIVFADNFLIPADKMKGAQQVAPTADAFKPEQKGANLPDIATRIEVAGRGTFPTQGDLVLHSNDVRTVLVDLPWREGARFEAVASNVLLRQTIGGVETWVCYGTPGDYGEVLVKRNKPGQWPSCYGFTYPSDDSVKEIWIESGDGHKALFLVMNTALADRTWAVKDRLVVGASFVQEDGSVELPPQGGKIVVYPGAKEHKAGPVQLGELPVLAGWQWREAARERLPDYDDAAWTRSQEALPMEGYDNFANRYGWYRTTLKAGAPTSLRPMGMDGNVRAFLNGEPAQLNRLQLKPGDNSLALFFKIRARPKLFDFSGPIGHGAARGIWGPFLSGNQPAMQVKDWKIAAAKIQQDGEEQRLPEHDNKGWTSLQAFKPANVSKKNQFWLRGTFENTEGFQQAVAYLPNFLPPMGTVFEGLALYVNGVPVGYYKTNLNLGVELQLKPGANTVLMKVAFGDKPRETPGKYDRPHMELWKSQAPLGWKFRGGLEGLEETAIIGRVKNWEEFLGKPWNKEGAPAAGLPVLWRTQFDYRPTQKESLGLDASKLKPGQVWLNGHNMGECPQQYPIYLPEPWLKEGANDLVILAGDGASPNEATLKRQTASQKLTF